MRAVVSVLPSHATVAAAAAEAASASYRNPAAAVFAAASLAARTVRVCQTDKSVVEGFPPCGGAHAEIASAGCVALAAGSSSMSCYFMPPTAYVFFSRNRCMAIKQNEDLTEYLVLTRLDGGEVRVLVVNAAVLPFCCFFASWRLLSLCAVSSVSIRHH
jgi:hypothetical protein